jgi:hypothetical protein
VAARSSRRRPPELLLQPVAGRLVEQQRELHEHAQERIDVGQAQRAAIGCLAHERREHVDALFEPETAQLDRDVRAR